MRTKASHIAFFIDSTHHFISAIPILYSSSSMHIHFSNQFSKYTALILLRKRPRETTIIIKTVGKCPSNCLARFPACKVNVGQRTVLALVLMLYPLRTHESQISQSEINLKRSRNVKKKIPTMFIACLDTASTCTLSPPCPLLPGEPVLSSSGCQLLCLVTSSRSSFPLLLCCLP